MQRRFFLFAICVFALAMQLFATSLASVPPSAQEHEKIFKKLRDWEEPSYAWTLKSWQKDDAPYLAIRQNIDLLAKQDRLRDKIATYAQQAKASPQDPKLQFRWAYAVWVAKKWLTDHDAQTRSLGNPQRALRAAHFPETFQYARLLFLTEAFNPTLTLPALMELPGSKIYARDPKDLEVKYFCARTFGKSAGSEPRKQKALQLLHELQRANPKDMRYLWAEANVYDTAWFANKHDQAAGDQAVEAYERYIKAANLNAQDRKAYEKEIAYIRGDQKLWADWDKAHPAKAAK